MPVSAILGEIERSLATRHELVLQAPPGAGKTTLVPLALLGAPWLAGQRILVLEPRRLAARAAAERMAALLGERVGETVGYRVRLESRVSRATRIEVVTEGILTRMLQDDPALVGTGVLVFDEFHERSLEADLGLALALAARALFRAEGPPLRLLVMSATLDTAAIARVLNDAPVLAAEGRSFPVTIEHAARTPERGDWEFALEAALARLLAEPPAATGSILVFLPGRAEIERLARRLRAPPDTTVVALHGGLDPAAQQRAIAPPAAGTRHVVLATNIAETSLTIEGVATVLDSGLAREPRYDPATGMTRLHTRRIARASATQRAGRAGRLGPGRCIRLWSESDQQALAAQATPEMLQADLAPLALALLAFGYDTPRELAWIDAPPAGAWAEALELLQEGGAIEPGSGGTLWRLTPTGQRMAALPMHPRLARMLLAAEPLGQLAPACALAAMLAERTPAGAGADLAGWLDIACGRRAAAPSERGWQQRVQRQAALYRALFPASRSGAGDGAQADPGLLLAFAYPDRIARRRGAEHALYQLGNGRSARLDEADPLAASEWLVAADLGGRSGAASDRIHLAAALDPTCFAGPLAALLRQEDRVQWDEGAERLVAERRRVIGALVLERQALAGIDPAARRAVLCELLRRRGLGLLGWTEALRQWQARVQLLRSLAAPGEATAWPELDDATLLATLEQWLAPHLEAVTTRADLARLDLAALLAAQLPWPLPRELERLAPERLEVPSGSRVAIDYLQSPPVLAVKLQEMFGCEQTPTVAAGRVALRVHLLSPAGRPLAITQDLAGFWRSAYAEVRKEMRGRYPKHPWPEDPLGAPPTRHPPPHKSCANYVGRPSGRQAAGVGPESELLAVVHARCQHPRAMEWPTGDRAMATCGEKLALLLEAWGIDTAFGIPGTHTIELYRGLPQTRIRHVSPRHEQGAGFMADGYARVTGRPAACITVSGPGALNIAGAMGQALADSQPMLVISADNRSWERGLGEGRLHETRNLQAAMAEVSRWSHTLARPDELPRVLARAFAIFNSERPGPVHLSVPLDVITANADALAVETWPLPSRPAADPSALARAAALLNAAERPVIALGGGAIDAMDAARALVEALDAPATLTHNAKGLLAPTHPLHVAGAPSYQPVRNLYLEADVILGIGTEFGETDYDFFFNGRFALGGKLVRIDIDAAQLARNARPEVAIQADARLALEALLPLVARRDRGGATRTRDVNRRLRSEDHPAYQAFLDCVQDALPEAILIGDSAQPAYYAAHQFHARAPRRFASAATGYGTLGYALPAALGAKLGRPDLPVVALHGDGGLQFTIAELASGVEARLAVAVLVWNNRRYEMIAQNFEAAGMAPIACDILTPDFVAIARAMGCRASAVRDHAALHAALREAAAAEVPTLIEVDERDFL